MSGRRSRTIADLMPRATERFADRAALKIKRDGQWTDVTYAAVGAIVQESARGLLELGLEKGDRVAILCGTRPDWTYAALAVSTAGGTVVPVYPTSSAEEIEWIVGDSGSKLIVCENATQVASVSTIRDRVPALEAVIVIESDGDIADAIPIGDVRARGRQGDAAKLVERTASVSGRDVHTIVYTSGTTGRPKGCVLSHRNMCATLDSVVDLEMVRRDDVSYLFLPLAHVLSLVLQLVSIEVGATVAYYGGDPARVIEELREVKPTYFPSVPRIFEKIYATVVPEIQREIGEDRLTELVALGVAVRDLEHSGQDVPAELRARWEPVDERLFAGVRAAFGGRIREAATGAAPIDKEVLEFFYAAGIPILEGYGMTETATAITVSTKRHHKFGTVGRALPGLELSIADDGEILVRGENVFEGYHRNATATAEALVDGWLRTGDLGAIDEDGYLTITGRKKDIIITSSGKNLTPAGLENDMRKCRYVSQAVMHGDRRPFPTMLITLDVEEIAGWARKHGKPEDVPRLSKDPDVHAVIQRVLDEANAKYARAEQVKKFFILDHDLSQQAGELTPTMKVKRSVVNERYAGEFDALYGASGQDRM